MQITEQERVEFYNYLVMQAMIFGELKIVPETNTYDFLYLLEKQIDFYHKKNCLSSFEKGNIYDLINQVRFHMEFKNSVEKEAIFHSCNEQIGKVNQITDENYKDFVVNRLKDYNYVYKGKRKYYDFYFEQYLPVLRLEEEGMCCFWTSIDCDDFYSNPTMVEDLIKDRNMGHRIDILLKLHPHMLEDEIIVKLKTLLLIQIGILDDDSQNEFDIPITINYSDGEVENRSYHLKKEEVHGDLNMLIDIYSRLEELEKKNCQLTKGKK